MRCLLISGVIDFTGGDLSPALDPQLAKMTFPVPDQQRLGRGIGNPLTALVSHKRRTSNVQRSTSNSESEFGVLCSMLGVRRYLKLETLPAPARGRMVLCLCTVRDLSRTQHIL